MNKAQIAKTTYHEVDAFETCEFCKYVESDCDYCKLGGHMVNWSVGSCDVWEIEEE